MKCLRAATSGEDILENPTELISQLFQLLNWSIFFKRWTGSRHEPLGRQLRSQSEREFVCCRFNVSGLLIDTVPLDADRIEQRTAIIGI